MQNKDTVKEVKKDMDFEKSQKANLILTTVALTFDSLSMLLILFDISTHAHKISTLVLDIIAIVCLSMVAFSCMTYYRYVEKLISNKNTLGIKSVKSYTPILTFIAFIILIIEFFCSGLNMGFHIL